MPTHDQYPSSQSEPNLVKAENTYDYEMPVNGKPSHSEYIDHISQGLEPHAAITTSNDVAEVCRLIMNLHNWYILRDAQFLLALCLIC